MGNLHGTENISLPGRSGKGHAPPGQARYACYSHTKSVSDSRLPARDHLSNSRMASLCRPVVVNRKVWGGNRPWLGAWGQSVLMSVMGTALLRRPDLLRFCIEALTAPQPALLPSPPP